MLYRFVPDAVETTWNLADATRRFQVIEDVRRVLDGAAARWFDLFDDRLRVFEDWDFDAEVLGLDAMAELLVFVGQPERAITVTQEAMSRAPWTSYFVDASEFTNLRRLAERTSLDLAVVPPRDPTSEAAAVDKLRLALDAYARRGR